MPKFRVYATVVESTDYTQLVTANSVEEAISKAKKSLKSRNGGDWEYAGDTPYDSSFETEMAVTYAIPESAFESARENLKIYEGLVKP